MAKKWKYESANAPGNLHVAAAWLSKEHPEWDVVAMHSTSFCTIIVYREEILEKEELKC